MIPTLFSYRESRCKNITFEKRKPSGVQIAVFFERTKNNNEMPSVVRFAIELKHVLGERASIMYLSLQEQNKRNYLGTS
jgi:hypothetical protein